MAAGKALAEICGRAGCGQGCGGQAVGRAVVSRWSHICGWAAVYEPLLYAALLRNSPIMLNNLSIMLKISP